MSNVDGATQEKIKKLHGERFTYKEIGKKVKMTVNQINYIVKRMRMRGEVKAKYIKHKPKIDNEETRLRKEQDDELIELYDDGTFSYKHMAEYIDVPINTIKTRLDQLERRGLIKYKHPTKSKTPDNMESGNEFNNMIDGIIKSTNTDDGGVSKKVMSVEYKKKVIDILHKIDIPKEYTEEVITILYRMVTK